MMASKTNTPPIRVQLRRSKSWKMPPNTVKVDRSTKWGNPFVVGKDGTAAECVDLYRKLMGGYLCLTSKATIESQTDARWHKLAFLHTLRGKNIACWCATGKICHADVLLEIANV